MRNYSMKTFVSIAVLGTLAFVIMLLQFPILPSAPFLKLDFSDIPALIGGLMFGPLAIILIELIKNVLEFIVSGSPVGVPIGEITNFLSGICFTLPIYYLFRHFRWYLFYFADLLFIPSFLTVVISIFNYFVLLPFYIKLGGLPASTDVFGLVVTTIVPFNLLKGGIVGAGFLLLYGSMKNFIIKNQTPKERMKYEKKRREIHNA
ncbi:riboflavin transporter [Listeria fleischmannii subsp. coloradonensis]|uniref:ECF transporter S component n=1 Tax=Listeria fleischmannii TaxID=1069827 RepID=UPI000254F1AF|nr:ECF transporter S component [Listeria fleischmannii]EIA21020.1 riboflavin transporter [Listeria fleischmannii subsp. coloradonensis]